MKKHDFKMKSMSIPVLNWNFIKWCYFLNYQPFVFHLTSMGLVG